MRPNRRLVGLLVAPLASGVLHAVSMGRATAGLAALVVAYPAAVLLGFPVWLLFLRMHWFRWWQAVFAGLGLGFLGGALFHLLFGSDYSAFSVPSVVLGLGLFALHGAVVAAVFWLVAVRGVSSNRPLNTDARQASLPRAG